MPTHHTNLTELSISQLAELSGRAHETVARVLRRAHVTPTRSDGRTLYFDPRRALPAIFAKNLCAHVGARRVRDAEQARQLRENFADLALLGSDDPSTPMATMDGAALLDVHSGWTWDDISELIGWGCP